VPANDLGDREVGDRKNDGGPPTGVVRLRGPVALPREIASRPAASHRHAPCNLVHRLALAGRFGSFRGRLARRVPRKHAASHGGGPRCPTPPTRMNDRRSLPPRNRPDSPVCRSSTCWRHQPSRWAAAHPPPTWPHPWDRHQPGGKPAVARHPFALFVTETERVTEPRRRYARLQPVLGRRLVPRIKVLIANLICRHRRRLPRSGQLGRRSVLFFAGSTHRPNDIFAVVRPRSRLTCGGGPPVVSLIAHAPPNWFVRSNRRRDRVRVTPPPPGS